MVRIEFTVKDRPPKKHGEKSMWAHPDEVRPIFSLKENVLEARSKAGLKDCFRMFVALELTVFTPRSKLASVGDLDNFITGVCDGLQAADPRVHPHKIFQEPHRKGIDPKNALLFDNDAKVVSIIAKKVPLKDDQEVYYKVAVEPIEMM